MVKSGHSLVVVNLWIWLCVIGGVEAGESVLTIRLEMRSEKKIGLREG